MPKEKDLKGATADSSFFSLEARTWVDPERDPNGPVATGQAKWSSLKQRQKGEPMKTTYTADEVSEIVKNAVAEALKAVSKSSEKEIEKKEPGEIKIGGK